MRVFLTSILIFLTVVSLTATNAVTFCERSAEIITALEELPEKTDGQHADHILNLWNRHKDFFNLTTSHTTTDKIEAEMCFLRNAVSTEELIASRDALLVLLKDMKEAAGFSIDRIL